MIAICMRSVDITVQTTKNNVIIVINIVTDQN